MAQRRNVNSSGGISFGAVVLIIVLIVIGGLYVYDEFSEPDDTVYIDTSVDTDGEDDTSSGSGVSTAPLGYEFYYKQLESDEKRIYDALKAKLEKGDVSVKVKDIATQGASNKMRRAIQALEHDHPEFIWVNGGYYSRTIGANRITCELEIELMCFEYWTHSFNPAKYRAELNREVNRISDMAKKYNTDYEKVQFVHDYIVKIAEYDHEGLEEFQKTTHDASSEYIFSAYGCLVNGKTVCAGYAKAFQMILNNLGINCVYVTGDAGEAHAWNLVEIADENYYIDVTWNDTSPVDSDGNALYPEEAEYDYYAITSKELSTTHFVEKDFFDIPTCDATEHNYFVFNGYYVENYSADEMIRIINAQSDKNMIGIKFKDSQTMKTAVDKMKEYIGETNIDKKMTYSSNYNMNTLWFYIKD